MYCRVDREFFQASKSFSPDRVRTTDLSDREVSVVSAFKRLSESTLGQTPSTTHSADSFTLFTF